jgi:hypothetical protein
VSRIAGPIGAADHFAPPDVGAIARGDHLEIGRTGRWASHAASIGGGHHRDVQMPKPIGRGDRRW